MGKVVSCLLLTSVLACHGSSAEPDKHLPPTTAAPTTTASPTTARPKFDIQSYCVAGHGTHFSKTGRRGDYFSVHVLVPLAGTETITEASAPDVEKVRKVGDTTSLRLLMTISCDAFLPDDESIADALKDDRESEASTCQGTNYLDLAALEAGKPFSNELHPFDEMSWRIRAIAPGFRSIEIGPGKGEDLRVTGIRPIKDKDMGQNLDMVGAHISWNYSDNEGRYGSSRIELAADCPMHME